MSAATKIAVFENESIILEKTIEHRYEDLKENFRMVDQYGFRKKQILEELDYEGINVSRLDAVCARGGLLRPIEGGTYKVSTSMLYDLKTGFSGEHPSNLGGVIAHEIASGLNIDAYIVDPVVVDELDVLARFSGLPEAPRKSIFHALSQKAAARKAADDLGKHYEDCRLIVAYLGDGITVGAHRYGKVADVNNGLYGEGPYTQERAGTVPPGELIEMCFSGQFSYEEMMEKLTKKGGLKAYLGTGDTKEVEKRILDGDQKAKQVYEGMAYQIAKEIGAMAAVLNGEVDGIVMTGPLSGSLVLTGMITGKVSWISNTFTYPDLSELDALHEGALRVLRDKETYKVYPTDEKGAI